MTGGTELKNVMREDVVIDDDLENIPHVLIDAVPEKKESWIKIKAVFEGIEMLPGSIISLGAS